MRKYLVLRVLSAVPTLIIVSFLIFAGTRVIPGNVCELVFETSEYTPGQCTVLRDRLGLDEPFVAQYMKWGSKVLTGDLGDSIVSGKAVLPEIQRRMYLTLEMTLLSAALGLAVGIPIGVLSAAKRNSVLDYGLRTTAIGWDAAPTFWIATLLITFPAVWWGYSSPPGYVQFWVDPLRNLEQLAVPAIALGVGLSARLARITRSSLLEVLGQDYIRTARAKGLRNRNILVAHALRNALIPVVTLFGLQLTVLLGGTAIIEVIFSLPGLGSLLLGSVGQKDFTMVQGVVLFYAVIVIVITLIVDLSYSLIDPRTRIA